MEEEADWSTLCPDLVRSFQDLLPLEDGLQLKCVCSTWKKACSAGQWRPHDLHDVLIPWIFDSTSSRGAKICRFLSLFDAKIYRCCLPSQIWGNEILGASNTWLLTIDKQANCMLAINPFTCSQLRFPPPENSLFFDAIRIEKISRSSSPSEHIVVIICCPNSPTSSTVAFARPGDSSWTYIRTPELNYYDKFIDVAFFKGNFYFISSHGKLLKLDLTGDLSSPDQQTFFDLEIDEIDPTSCNCENQLVESTSKDELWLVTLKHNRVTWYNRKIEFPEYMIFKFNERGLSWEKVETMGDEALLIGKSSVNIVSTSKIPSLKRNCIYNCWIPYSFEEDEWFHGYDYEEGEEMKSYQLPKMLVINGNSDEKDEPIWIVPQLNLVKKFY